ncbi:HAD family phosphatase [Jannaschia sp. Os4]|uniref:HAD family hydrolase n=1 Tax=Jannaschia sp. Os4 TaxID=2807617 RepID=UPI00193A60E0|nr:HAD family phosphatase [Jannaschia sp. Os4]MBM2574903.1 HAD family phosphatase [Jannaschia sp. Os4]
MRVDLVLFDLDGVLVDSEPLSGAALIAELAACGIRIDADRVRRDFLGRSFVKVAEGLRASHGDLLPADFEARYRARLFAAFEDGLRATPGVAAMLDRLRAPSRVATSSTPLRAATALRIAGLAERFEGRVDTASEVPRGKPAPDLFLLAAQRGGVPPERCLVIEDSAPGLMAAAAAGIPSVLYLGGGHHAGRDWDGPAPSVGTLTSWEGLCDLCPALLED